MKDNNFHVHIHQILHETLDLNQHLFLLPLHQDLSLGDVLQPLQLSSKQLGNLRMNPHL